MSHSFPEFLNRAMQINMEIEEMRACVGRASDLRERGAESSVGNRREDFVREMEGITEAFRGKSLSLKEKIGEMKRENEKYFSRHGRDRYFLTRLAHFQSLAKRIADTMEHFGQIQKEFDKCESARLKSQYLIARPCTVENELEQIDSSENGRSLFRSAFVHGDKSAKQLLYQAEQRKGSMEYILQSISELNDLSHELEGACISKESVLDRVHVHASHITKKSAEVTCDLESAVHVRRRSARFRRYRYFMLGLFTALILIWMYIKLR
jgi:t-SNARE complex subunit (syntaxin)